MDSAVYELLGGERVLGFPLTSGLDLARATRKGLPSRAAIELEAVFQEYFERGSALSEIEERILSGLLRDPNGPPAKDRLTPVESDVVVRTATALARAILVLGQVNRAVHWLSSPNTALGGEAPISLLDTSAGEHEVEALLDRIEYGVYS